MNRRSMLQVCAGVLALGFGVRAVAHVPGWKICHEKGHQMGSKTYTTDYPVNGYPAARSACTRRSARAATATGRSR